MATESEKLKLHAPCAHFDLPGIDGKSHSLDSYATSKVLVVGFTCNHCPYVQAYESRLMALCEQYKNRGVAFVCINANDDVNYPEDSFEEMKKRAARLNFNFDYLRDETQKVAHAFKAACTPEFYVYDSERTLRYHGRLDDNHKEAALVKDLYLKNALEDLLDGRAPRVTQTAALGCSIKWKTT